VLDLEPLAAATMPIWRVAPLRNNAFEPERASVFEDDLAQVHGGGRRRRGRDRRRDARVQAGVGARAGDRAGAGGAVRRRADAVERADRRAARGAGAAGGVRRGPTGAGPTPRRCASATSLAKYDETPAFPQKFASFPLTPVLCDAPLCRAT